MKNRIPLVVLALYAVIAAVMVLLIDWGASGTIAHWRIIELYRHSQGNLATLEAELIALGQTVKAAEVTVAKQHSTATPTVDDLRQLAADHRLRFRQLERISTANSSTEYGAVLQGRITAIVGFLKDLEDDYRLAANYALLQPANEGGTLVELRMQLETAGP